LGGILDFDDQRPDTFRVAQQVQQFRRLARHEHRGVEHGRIASADGANPDPIPIHFGRIAHLHAELAQARAIDDDRVGLLQRLDEVIAEVVGQGDGAADRVDHDDLHALAFSGLAVLGEIGPKRPVHIQRLYVEHVGVPINLGNIASRLAGIVAEEAFRPRAAES